MVSPLHQLWKPMASSETVKGGVEAAKAVFELAKTLNEQKDNNPHIKQLVEKIPTLLEALNSPIGQVVSSSLPFVSLATGLIKFTFDVTKKEPTISQSVAIVAQAAYLESIKATLAIKPVFVNDESKTSEEVQKQIKQLGAIEIDDEEARLTLVSFHGSKLAQAFSQVLLARLEETRIERFEVDTWVQRVSANTPRYIHKILAKSGDGVQELINWYSSGGRNEFDKYLSIDTYLEEKIKQLPNDQVFREEFSFQQIYVPLKAVLLNENGEKINNSGFFLDKWVQKTILDIDKQDRVIFIEAGPGRGKTVFCRMFADWARQKLHPLLTPIFIRLRDIDNFEQNFSRILSDVLSHCDFVSNDRGWLTDRNTQYLFLLDGFDELRIEGRASGGIQRFIDQVGRFQQNFKGKETGHRIILTGRSLALQGIYLPENFQRIELLPMDDDIQTKWLEKWQKVVILDDPVAAAVETNKFKEFLQADNCPKEVKDDLAREPLLLYLLAQLHKNQEIQENDFQQAENSTQAKILIYQKSLEWVLKEQRNELDQYKITGLNINSLERILTEAGLCVVQSGGEYAKVKMIETRLKRDDSDAANIIKELRRKGGEKALLIALGAFYLRAAGGGGVEFYHKIFGEFLCAKRLQASLEEWTEQRKNQQKLVIDDEQLVKKIYDLLGYGSLTPEIVEFLGGLLIKSQEFKPVELFQRLEKFYWSWCNGEFIDADGTTQPQTKMRELKEQLPARENYLGQRQIDVYTGLNIIILLLELHRYSQKRDDLKTKINFHPCGKCNDQGELEEEEDNTLLLRIINLSSCLGNDGFFKTVGSFLTEANLSRVNLSHSNLSRVNLSRSNLSGAILRQVDLSEANLSHVNFTDADMCRCDLTGSDLNYAILKNAYLRGADCREAKFNYADLEEADLCRAYLYNTDFSDAIFSKVSVKKANLEAANFNNADFNNLIWDVGTQWFNVRGLHKTKNIPEKLSSNLDFQDGQQLSIALEKLDLGQISEAIKIYEKIADQVEQRLKEDSFKAHLYNKITWLSFLFDKNNLCIERIVNLAHQAVTLNPKNGNYKDTYGVILAIQTHIRLSNSQLSIVDFPPPFSQADDDFYVRENINRGNPYKKSITLFKEALDSEDFKKLALPNVKKIRQRREDWIEKLEKGIYPFIPEMISLLLKEEY